MKSALIVDDNPTVRRALRAFIQIKLDLHVCDEAVDGADAVRKAKALRPDLVLMDLFMPLMSGADAAIAIKQSLPNTRIIIFSMFSDLVGKRVAGPLGVDVVVDKADGADGLLTALSQVLASGATDQPTA